MSGTGADIGRWQERFSTADYVFGTEPNAFLVAEAHRLAAGSRVLAVADGEGRNGVWLAGQGHQVLAIDAAPAALAKAQALAAARGVAITTEQADLAQWDWGESRFDAIVAIFIQFAGPELRARMFAGMRRALKPGGWLLIEGYGLKQLEYRTGGPAQRENLYTPELLREAFAGFDILHLVEREAELDEGSGHRGRSALVDLVARKPR